MTKPLIHISDAEAANDLAAVLARARAGADVILDGEEPIVVPLRSQAPRGRLLSESPRLPKRMVATESYSMSLIKSTSLSEGAKFQFGAEAANVFNHRNYDMPDMNVDDGPTGFGITTQLQTAEGAGPRNIEITGRISF